MTLLVCGAGVSIFELITKLEPKWDGEEWWWVLAGLTPTTWVVWAIYFYRSIHGSAPEIQIGRLKRHLWTGSILELLVAIPTHIVARHREHCCAGYLTFIGLTCGISVMCFAFGPAVYFLFVERWKRLHPEAAEALATSAAVESRAVAKPPNLVNAMRNSALVVAALYAFLWNGAFWLLPKIAITTSMRAGMRGFESSQDEWGLWPILVPLVLAQYLFLRVPVALACRQTVQAGTRWSTVLAASFMMGVVVVGAGMSITEVLYGGMLDPESRQGKGVAIDLMLISWVCCAIYFNVALQSSSLDRAMARLRTFLLFGSLIELMVAIPMHIVVSQRDYHYVGAMTSLGLICGISGLLFAVGPALYDHLAERWKHMHPEA